LQERQQPQNSLFFCTIVGTAHEATGERWAASAITLLSLLSPLDSTILKNTFPLKKEEQIQELMETGGWQPNSSNSDLLNYHLLFTEVHGGGAQELAHSLP
jgi:hypothetical protein